MLPEGKRKEKINDILVNINSVADYFFCYPPEGGRCVMLLVGCLRPADTRMLAVVVRARDLSLEMRDSRKLSGFSIGLHINMEL